MFKVEIGYEIYERGCVDHPFFKVENKKEFYFYTGAQGWDTTQYITYAVYALYRDCLSMAELQEYLDSYDGGMWHVRVLLLPSGSPAGQYVELGEQSSWLDTEMMQQLIDGTKLSPI